MNNRAQFHSMTHLGFDDLGDGDTDFGEPVWVGVVDPDSGAVRPDGSELPEINNNNNR